MRSGYLRAMPVPEKIRDPDVRILASLAATLETVYEPPDDPWAGSPFGWIKRRPSRQVGAIGERLIAGWLATRDFDVARCSDTEADRLVNGHRVEIKFSTLWKSGVFKFQQIRDQRYDLLLMLGLMPFDARCWVIPKKALMQRWGDPDGPRSQHAGQAGRDTAWLSFPAQSPPLWLAPFGGTLAQASRALRKLVCRTT